MEFLKLMVFSFAILILKPYSIAGIVPIFYEEDNTNFPNPDRGFFQLNAKTASDLVKFRNTNGTTMEMIYYHLDPYRSQDILPQKVFDDFIKDANEARTAGAKIIPRFIYTWDQCPNPPEAPLPRMLLHIDQLSRTLRENSDVIAHLQAGLIGLWGEWHHYGCSDPNKLDNPTAQKQILFKLLDAIPNRSVAVRYPYAIMNIYGNNPLGPDSAFSGSYKSRTGGHNDSFRSGFEDRGTYTSNKVEAEKQFASLHNRYVPQSGETCGDISKYSGCDSALTDFKRMHWDNFSEGTGSCARFQSSWKSGGCYETIQKKLGYRLKLLSANLQDSVRPGFKFTGTLSLINIGWGKIYNPRGCELVFRNIITKNKFIVSCAVDPRRWTMSDSTVLVSLEGLIPQSTPEGAYELFLNLPDTASSIHNRPEYSIRLANLNVWDESTGYNSLLHTVKISHKASLRLNGANRIKDANSNGFRISRQGRTIECFLPQLKAATLLFELYSLSGNLLTRNVSMANKSGHYSLPIDTEFEAQDIRILTIKGDGLKVGNYLLPNN
jgi:Domain of unknown function (DUF4832)/Domain of unknown function (DUF4874)